jgi:hypothetical protein
MEKESLRNKGEKTSQRLEHVSARVAFLSLQRDGAMVTGGYHESRSSHREARSGYRMPSYQQGPGGHAAPACSDRSLREARSSKKGAFSLLMTSSFCEVLADFLVRVDRQRV